MAKGDHPLVVAGIAVEFLGRELLTRDPQRLRLFLQFLETGVAGIAHKQKAIDQRRSLSEAPADEVGVHGFLIEVEEFQ